MPRVKRGNKRVQRRKKILTLAKGYRLTKSKLHRSAKESVDRALQICLPGPPHQEAGLPQPVHHSRRRRRPSQQHFLQQIYERAQKGRHTLDRRVLAEIAIKDPETFTRLTETAKAALAAA